jgi:hypothetical protein
MLFSNGALALSPRGAPQRKIARRCRRNALKEGIKETIKGSWCSDLARDQQRVVLPHSATPVVCAVSARGPRARDPAWRAPTAGVRSASPDVCQRVGWIARSGGSAPVARDAFGGWAGLDPRRARSTRTPPRLPEASTDCGMGVCLRDRHDHRRVRTAVSGGAGAARRPSAAMAQTRLPPGGRGGSLYVPRIEPDPFGKSRGCAQASLGIARKER